MAAAETKKSITEEQQQELDDVFARAQKALAIIETYDQARVDRLCQAVAWAVANKQTFTRLVDMSLRKYRIPTASGRRPALPGYAISRNRLASMSASNSRTGRRRET